MMRMMRDIKKALIIVATLDVIVIMIALYQGDAWLINTQLAFLSSLFVTLASYYSYKRVIEKRLELEEAKIQRDSVEQIDDPFDLYSPEVVDEEKDFKEIIKEERAKVVSLKQTGVNLYKSLGGAFSPWRLLSYLFLFLAFLYLVNNKLFVIWAYVGGLFIVPISAMIFAIMIRDKNI